MTVKQKAARAKFTKAIAEAKKLRAKNPKLTQAAAVKQAFAILYSADKPKKVGAVKKKAAPKKKAAVKKASPKKKAATKKATSVHKDTKSHNVNIRVMSGIKDLEKLHYNIYDLIKMVEKEKKSLVQKIVFNGKLGEAFYTKPEITLFRKQIIMLNKRISALKKLAKEQQKAENIFNK
jgi:hypothetical protein